MRRLERSGGSISEMFRFYMKKLLRCPATWVGGTVFFLSMVFGVAETLPHPDPMYLYDYAMNLGVSGFFLPVATVLPICFVRRELTRGSAWQFPLIHTAPLRYTGGGLVAACLSGAIVSLIGFAAFFLFAVLTSREPLRLDTMQKWCIDLDYCPFWMKTPSLFFVFSLVILIVRSMMFPAIAYAVSAYSSNQYLCAASPFVLFMLMVYGAQRLGGEVNALFYYFDPSQLSCNGYCGMTTDGGMVFLFTYVGIVVILCGLLFWSKVSRRLRYG